MEKEETKHILLLPPQLICYARLFLILIAFIIFNHQASISLFLVFLSECLDMLDGYVARAIQYETPIGSILDFIIDRLAVIFGFSVLIALRPTYFPIFSFLLAIDLLGHMAMLYCGMLFKNISNHKKLFHNLHFLLDWYYATGKRKWFMVFTIVSYDIALFFLILYCLTPNAYLLRMALFFSVLGIIKAYIHLLHLYYSFKLTANASMT